MRMKVLPAAAVGVSLLGAISAQAGAPEQISFPGGDGALQGWLYAPGGAGAHPAIVALHGCAGLTDKSGAPSARHADWGQRLAAAGFVVLFPDSFASRGLGPQCKESNREARASRERVADAEDALRFLAGRPDVDPRSIFLIGWSNGGSSTLYAVQPKHGADGVDFARAVAFYPGCRTPLETGRWKTRMPLLILIGGADDWTPPAPCVDLAAQAKAQGDNVETVVYPDAYHDFDHPGLAVHVVDGLAYTASGGGSAHTGTNAAARADAIKRVESFLGVGGLPAH
ncbi:dienelactone hydrolase [Methylocella silvestris BL2]|uniref:Dienelactone hydrolase n=1 Tax=Methylocella silvestris (strain DSM 15510 / CIP 108128 / LMG 27833 / NCIMB 13906 / BL2) TaxID=395965 RepID=B8ENX0_METSB|nr:dienelactone hydrolase family protein [Methylocella silvestris]ACK49208.1 dienelactone hydrolase [Methylocella silvestris BL2]